MLLETNDTGNAYTPRIAFDSMGNAIAVWQQLTVINNVATNNIWANRYIAGSGWGTAIVIGAGNGPQINAVGSPPQIAVDTQGNAIVVWELQAAGDIRINIWANRYVAGSGWGMAMRVQTGTDTAHDPQIVIDKSGNAWAVWTQLDANNTYYNIFASHYVVGTGWGVSTRIDMHNNVHSSSPQIAIDANGNVMAVWSEYSVGTVNSQIWANRYTAGSGWGAATLIQTESASDARDQRIAVDANGNAIAVWTQTDNTGIYHIVANRYSVASGWGTATHLETAVDGVSYPEVAFDNSGNAFAVWVQRSPGHSISIWANRYTVTGAGTGWSTPTLIETDSEDGAITPRIAIDMSGNAIVVWEQTAHGNPNDNIWANRYTITNGWGTAATIETNDAGNATSPRVTVDTNGNAIAVWAQKNSTGVYSIWANRFE
ncbi:MAG TPA: hypothetical protein VHL14_08360 [Steroidobacteraceae bacterium]|nr:hypothetical protein [Steroidobacteraceae bacterium]